MYTVYILKCADGKPYINNGHVPATENRRPIKLVTHVVFEDKYKAFGFKKYLKSGSGRAFLKKTFLDQKREDFYELRIGSNRRNFVFNFQQCFKDCFENWTQFDFQ